jgi:hypothetical protein
MRSQRRKRLRMRMAWVTLKASRMQRQVAFAAAVAAPATCRCEISASAAAVAVQRAAVGASSSATARAPVLGRARRHRHVVSASSAPYTHRTAPHHASASKCAELPPHAQAAPRDLPRATTYCSSPRSAARREGRGRLFFFVMLNRPASEAMSAGRGEERENSDCAQDGRQREVDVWRRITR